MKIPILSLFCLLAIQTYSQHDSTSAKTFQIGTTHFEKTDRLINPVFVIKGDALRRFPTFNFLEAVNGMFPWVFSFEPSTNDFSYVVDGSLIADINALSLYDIDEIVFMRGNLEAGIYPFAKKGCFIIRTKNGSAPDGFSFNANTGLTISNSARPIAISPMSGVSYDSSRSTGLFQNYHLSYSGKAGKSARYYLSANFIHEKDPEVSVNQKGAQYEGIFNYQRRTSFLRFNAGTSIKLLSNLQLDIRGTAAIQRTTIDSSIHFTPNGFSGDAHMKLPENYFAVLASLNWKINDRFTNTFSFAYSHDKERLEFSAFNSNQFRTIILDSNKLSRGYFQNTFSYHSDISKSFSVTAGVTVRYHFDNISKTHYRIVTNNTQPSGAEAAWNKGWLKPVTVVPSFTAVYKNLLSLYGGLQVFADLIDAPGFKLKGGSKVMPYTGMVFSVMNLFATKKTINRFDLGIHYSKRNSNLSDLSRLDRNEIPEQFFPANVYTLNSSTDLNKDKIITVQATAGFLDDRLLVGAEWSEARDDRFFILFIPATPSSQIAVLDIVKTKGISFYSQAKLINQEKTSWNIRLNVVKQEITNKYLHNIYTRNYYPVTMGLQHDIVIRNFLVQVNSVMGFDKKLATFMTPFATEKVDDFSIQHLLLAYRLPTSHKWMREIQPFIQAKNIIASKTKNSYQDWPKYIGIGVSASL